MDHKLIKNTFFLFFFTLNIIFKLINQVFLKIKNHSLFKSFSKCLPNE